MIRDFLAPARMGALLSQQSDSLWIFAERAISNVLNFLAIVAIMRILGPVAYGQWAFAFSIVSLLLVTGHLGLDGLLIRKLVEQPSKAKVLLGVTATMKYAIYLPAIAATLVFFSVQANIDAVERSLLQVLLIAVLVAPLTSSFVAWSNAQSNFGAIARGRIIAIAVGFSAKIAFILGGFGIVTVGAAHSAMFILESLILLIVVGSHGGAMPWHWRFDAGTAIALLRQSLFLFAATIFGAMYFTVDIMVLRAFRGAYEVGLYAIVPQIILASQLVPYAVTLARFPDLARIASESADRTAFYRQIERAMLTLLALSVLAAGVLGAFTFIAFDLVFGSEYEATKPILWIACLALPPIFMRQLTTKIYIITDQGRQLATFELFGLLTVLAILLLGVPQYGALAAVTGVVVGCWLAVALSLAGFDGGRFVFRRAGASTDDA